MPVAPRAQTWWAPAPICVKLAPPDTATGIGLSVLVALPNWPLPFRPQQYANHVSAERTRLRTVECQLIAIETSSKYHPELVPVELLPSKKKRMCTVFPP